ncbi:MAG: heme lyase CcmF/NrfE family subunit [Actinobacteria bacterium]|nr:heme lyase CcmF/NrfE family subunit [Actinomycetota bacterium]
MSAVGYTALLMAVVISAYGIIASLVGARTGRRNLIKSGENAVYALCGVVVLAALVLMLALVSRDFTLEYVAGYTSRGLSWFYTITAFWAGNGGSMLLWLTILSVFAAIVVYQNRRKNRELLPYVISILMAIALFFSLLMTLLRTADPFVTIPTDAVPADGAGLNPMLENPGMVVHPVTTYLGYVGFSIPFAFAMGALITRRLGDAWIRSTRRWTLLAWFFLTIGNLVGAWWAYVTLGWGGFWGWDPVENSSFLPWLVGTAFLHSVMIQEKKDMLKVWNVVLIILTFVLTIFGTFLTRSGIISSVHAFGEGSFGPFFVAFMGITLIFSLGLLFTRLDMLKSRNELDGFVSRETSFLLNNLILVAMAFAILWGVLFPIISEAVTGNKVTVGPPFFNQVIRPIGLVFMLITGICPLIAWRRATFSNLRKNFVYPAAGAAVALTLLLVFGVRGYWALISFTLSAFVLTTILLEFARGTWVRRQMSRENIFKALGSLLWRNKRRYGGYIVHAGVILAIVGITGSFAFKQEARQTLTQGQELTVGRYQLTFDSVNSYETSEKQVSQASFTVSDKGRFVGTVSPVKEYYPRKDQNWTRIDRNSNLSRDVYVALLDYSPDTGQADVQVDINPLVSWLWIGGFVMALGAVIAMWPDRRESRRVAARYERHAELNEA